MIKMRSITYLSDSGYILQFNQNGNYFLKSIDLNSVSVSFSESQPIGIDGVHISSSAYGKKIITASGMIVANNALGLAKLREYMAFAMNIHDKGWLVVELRNGSKKKIRAMPNQTPSFGDQFNNGQPVNLEWQCERPYWLDYDETVLQLGHTKRLFHFPFAAPVRFGHVVSNITVHNKTNISIPVTVEIFTAAANVILQNKTSGETITVRMSIQSGEKMVIDSLTANIEIVNLKTGERYNATNKLEAGSQPINLMPGENLIDLQTGGKALAPLAYLRYNNHSLGV